MKRLRTLTICLLSLFAALFVLSGPALASATAGQIKGQVIDDGGLAIPGALLTLSSPALIGGAQQATSDDNGGFIFAELAPGSYKLMAQKVGFGPVTKTDVPVQLGRTTTVTVEMKYGGETVIIEERRKTVDTESASNNTTLSKEFLSRIPTGRSYQEATLATAGVTGGGDGNPNAGGASSNENTFLLDGINVTDPVTGTFSMNFNYDAIEEIQVITAGYDPEYGDSLGATISVVTRSGGNTLEVIADGFYQNGAWAPKLDSRYAADGLQIAPTGFDETSQTVQAAVTVSGPIVKDRVWFIGSYEYDRTLYAVLGSPLPRDFESHYFFGKLTMQPNSAHRFTLQLNTDPTTVDNIIQGDPFTRADAQARQAQGGYVASAKWNWFINPEANLDSNVSFQKTFITQSSVPCTHDKSIGYNPCDPGEAENHTDYATPGRVGLYGAYSRDNFGSFYFDNRYNLDVYSKLSVLQVDFFGKHDFKVGAELNYLIWDQTDGQNGGLLYYDLYENPFDPNTLKNYYWVEYGSAYEYHADGTHLGAFIQDVYKPVENLTFRYGVRYDRASVRNDKGYPVVDVGVFGPRVYAIWDPWNNAKTKVFGGYGRFNDVGRLGVASYLSTTNPGAKLVTGESFGSDGTSSAGNVYFDYNTTNTTTVWDNLAAPHSDQFTLGSQREVVNDLAAGITFEGKFTRDLYELDELNYLYDEDGYAQIGSTTASADPLYRVRTPTIALRDYYKTDFTLLRNRSDRWELQSTYSYVVSRGRTQNTLGGSLVNPAQVELAYGNLDTDIRHQVKVYASWDIPDDPWTSKLGLAAYYFSGTPFSRYYYSPGVPSAGGGYDLLKENMGTYGRRSPSWQLSVLLQQSIPTKKGKLTGTAELDNMTNNRYATVYYGYYRSAQNRYVIYYRQPPISAQVGLKYEF